MFFVPIEKTRWPPRTLIGWDIFDFSSETAEQNSTKLDRKQYLNVLYQVCVFRAYRKNKMATLASDWLRHFWLFFLKLLNGIQWNLTGSKILTSSTKFVFFGPIGKNKMSALTSDWLRHFGLLLWNIWTEFNKTWQEARSERPLPSWCFWGLSENKMAALASDCWDIFDFSETAEGNSKRLDRKQDLNALYQVCVFGPIGKTRWLPWPLIGWDIFDFSSETAERNSTKLDTRKQNLNVLYQVCVIPADRKKTRWPPWPLIGWDIFDFSETAEWNSMKFDRKQYLSVLYQVCVFQAEQLTKMVALANPSKRWHIVLRCTICGPLGLLFMTTYYFYVS